MSDSTIAVPLRSSAGFGALLKTWRQRRGLSQLTFAEVSGASQRHISFRDSGPAQPSPAAPWSCYTLAGTQCLAARRRRRHTLPGNRPGPPFQRFELQTRLLGWDDKWTFIEHHFVRGGRVLGLVSIRGLFKAASGPLKPDEFASAMGVSPVSPALPDWVLDWHRSCDGLSQALRVEEAAQEASAAAST
ncbi:MAG: hypothetical protein ABWY06_00370 [Pseudomonas sp.]|uniref:hypothetical protein n=1 Tax=Pseudomonas sp. TaxID=306 RepID=UPI0033924A25